MTIKLRIPIYLMTFGIVSGIFQLAMRSEMPNVPSLILTLAFFLIMGFILYTFEKVQLTEKETHFSFGILLVAIGFLADYFMR